MLNAVSVIDDFRGGSVMDDLLDIPTTEVPLAVSTTDLVVSVIEGCRLVAAGLVESGENSLALNAVPLGVTGDDFGIPPIYRDLFKSPK